ncbi:MAG: hypothetical protein ACRD7E_31835, partial [Bryobacteraceae bacterium]
GFQRAHLPTIERALSMQESRMISAPSGAANGSGFFRDRDERTQGDPSSEEPAIDVTANNETSEEQPQDDLDMPAFLRRERRLFQ